MILSDEEKRSAGNAATAERGALYLAGSAFVVGAKRLLAEEVDRAFHMPIGKLRKCAGLESLAYAAEGEDEVVLGARAAQQSLGNASCAVQEVDWIIATSETHHAYPSLAARLHGQLLARETCGALDVGGACLGLLNGLAVAQALLSSGPARTVLVVTADVHSRVLAAGRVAGEFGGLFGDGASAFLLRAAPPAGAQYAYRFGEFLFGCASQYAGAIRVGERGAPELEVHFDGEALSRAAITRLEKVIVDLEARSGLTRSSLAGLATHQPNPRLVALLAKQCGLPEQKFPQVASRFGNLGSSTTGVALQLLLELREPDRPNERGGGAIFLASLGPGLLYGGGWLVTE